MYSWKIIFLLFICVFLPFKQIDSFNFHPSVGMYYSFHETKMVFMDAQNECLKRNSTLAMPKNQNEADVLKTYITQKYSYGVFLGFHSLFGSCDYVSLEDNSIQYYYHIWEPKEPSDAVDKRCVAMTGSGKLRDMKCDRKTYFFCQRGDSVNVYSEAKNYDCISKDIGYSYVYKLRKCYKMHLTPRNWGNARAICRSERSKLAVIKTDAEKEHLTMLINNPENSVVCGRYPEYIFIGTDRLMTANSTHDDKNEVIVNLHKCQALNKNSGDIDDVGCETESAFICEQQKSPQKFEQFKDTVNFQIGNIGTFNMYNKH